MSRMCFRIRVESKLFGLVPSNIELNNFQEFEFTMKIFVNFLGKDIKTLIDLIYLSYLFLILLKKFQGLLPFNKI